MKNLLVIVFLVFSTFAYSQGIKIKWEDKDGREFAITAPSGNFSYGMLVGDNITYDAYHGKVTRVGSVNITYDAYHGKVIRVGSVNITYDVQENVYRVGGLSINYDINGRISGTSGRVN